jgi:hypothetical protein
VHGVPSSHDAVAFRDENGALWWVHEVSGQALGSSLPSCLLLVSTNHLRRIWTYPPDWRSRAPAELLALPETMP